MRTGMEMIKNMRRPQRKEDFPHVTNDPSLIINPDNDNDDKELYGAPVRPMTKPRFIDVTRLTNAWCQHYPGVA
jgi:hypothetical protein